MTTSSNRAFKVVLLPGDGVGPEVIAEAAKIMELVCQHAGQKVTFETKFMGGAAIDATGNPLPDETLSACKDADVVLLGAVGGPKWDHLRGAQRCESGLLKLRKELGLFANLRPVKVQPSLATKSAVKAEILEGVDLLVVRELTGGAYFGEPKTRDGSGATERAVDTTVYTRHEIERIARCAFELAGSRRRKLTSVDKANVLVTSQLWRDVVTEVSVEYPAVELEHQLVDSCAMRLVQSPRDFDVLVTENLFGDILTDEAAVLAGSLGLLPSASIGNSGVGVYEPIHGSAPDIAGKGLANPIGTILSVAMALRLSMNLPEQAEAVEEAVAQVIDDGIVTPELGGTASTSQIGAAVLDYLATDNDGLHFHHAAIERVGA